MLCIYSKAMRKYSQVPIPGLRMKKKKNIPVWKEKVATAQGTLAEKWARKQKKKGGAGRSSGHSTFFFPLQ